DGEGIGADAEEDVVAEIDVAGLAVQPVPALRDDVGVEEREQEGREIGAAEHRDQGGSEQNGRDGQPARPPRRPLHVALRDRKPCGTRIRIASSSMMLSPGAQSELQKKPVSASATPRKMPASSAPGRLPMPPRMMMVNAFTVSSK